jgi:hypothetical protein
MKKNLYEIKVNLTELEYLSNLMERDVLNAIWFSKKEKTIAINLEKKCKEILIKVEKGDI